MWADFFKVFTYAFTDDPVSKRSRRDLGGAGVSQPDAIPDVRAGQDGSWGGGSGTLRLRDTNDFVDLSTVTNRVHRYKEYERLRNMAEIEHAMTVFADEACFAGTTKVATPHGFRTLKELAENEKDKFLVYCYDFEKEDYTLGWAFNPRMTGFQKTIKVILDDGSHFVCTPDHLILARDEEWVEAGDLKEGDFLMPFYRLPARSDLTQIKQKQFPRIFTHKRGWVNERQFIDEFTTGEVSDEMELVNKYCRMIAQGLTVRQITKLTGNDFRTVRDRIERAGFSNKEVKHLGQNKDRRRVVSVLKHKKIEVYDISVEKHENFCTNWGVAHNCQKDDEGRTLKVECKNEEIKEELEFLLFHRKMLNFDQKKTWDTAKRLFIYGDFFWEIVINLDNPKEGVLNLVPLPPDSMYRMETTKGKLVEFQQSKEGPDYESLARVEVTQATDADLQQAKAIRFAPEQIIHVKIGDDRKTFYPYGVSLVEAARGPAHQLRLMEDAMVVYRLCLTGDTRIKTPQGWKYIKDIQNNDTVYAFSPTGNLIPTKVEKQICNGIKEIWEVKSKHISLKGTATHPVLVNRNGVIQYIDIQDLDPLQDLLITTPDGREELVEIPRFTEKWAKLSPSQKIKFKENKSINKSLKIRKLTTTSYAENRIKQFLYSKNKALPYDLAVKICDEFKLNKNNLILCNKGESNSKRIKLPNFVNEDFARLFGFLIGDGWIRKNEIGFASGTDEYVNQKYARLLEEFFSITKYQDDPRSKGGKYIVNSTIASKILKNMGFISGAHNKRIPDWVFRSSKAIRKSFIEGLADADGSIKKLKSGLWTAEFEMCNKKLVEDIKELWNSCDLCSGHIRYRKRKHGHEIVKGRKIPECESWSIYISEKTLEPYEKIIQVQKLGEENVYDITVENELHNFIANGTPVHNTRAPERRVFYIDVQGLPPYKAEAFIERMKDQFKKKKVASGRGGKTGASSVEERWHAPAADEDYWIPIRPSANTRVETLPGAQNLGEIDDTVYFRNKLFTALNFPKSYWNNEDTQSTRIALSAQDVKFARMIERLQSHIEDSFWEICDRHLRLLGYPEDAYEDLEIKMTPPSDWRELTRAEVITNRLNNASNLKGSQLMSDYDILVHWLKYTDDEAKEMLARLKLQKLEELKLQIIAQNPRLLGVGLPGPDDTEIGSEIGGPNPILGGEESGMPPGAEGQRKYMDADASPNASEDPMGDVQQNPQGPTPNSGATLPEPSEEDIKAFNLDIQDYSKEMDEEDVDWSSL